MRKVERVHNVYKYYYDLNFIDEVLSRKLRMKNLTHRVTVTGIATEGRSNERPHSHFNAATQRAVGMPTAATSIPAIRYFDRPTLTFCWGNYGSNSNSVRLRWEELPQDQELVNARAYVQSPSAVQFLARAIKDATVVKGALCQGFWILAPFPDLLKGRRVTCQTVVMADILNCGAEVQFDKR